MELPAKEHKKIVLDIKRFGIKTRWEMEISILDFPNMITDTMISGPFHFFQHERHFIPLENGETQMRETLMVSLPLGWFGDMFYNLIKKEMDAMFEFRHMATQRYFLRRDAL